MATGKVHWGWSDACIKTQIYLNVEKLSKLAIRLLEFSGIKYIITLANIAKIVNLLEEEV